MRERARTSTLGFVTVVRLDVVHAGSETFPLTREIRALAARRIRTDLRPLVR